MSVVSLSIPYLYILHIAVVSVRVGATLLFAPIWGYPGLPHYLKVLFVFSIATVVSVMIPFNADVYVNPGLILPTELLVGLLLAMAARIAFAGLHFAGQLVSFHLGFSMVQAIDPQTMNRSTLMSSYFTLLGYMMILASNQHYVIFKALADSYKAFPVGASVTFNQWLPSVIETSKQIFVIGWKIALPVFFATFILELAVGFMARMQPQVSSMVVTAPLKLLVGMIVLGASLSFIPRVIGPVLNTMVLRK
jgi:flagellar biosynthesis protein FliR